MDIVRRWIGLFNQRDIEGLVSLTEPGQLNGLGSKQTAYRE